MATIYPEDHQLAGTSNRLPYLPFRLSPPRPAVRSAGVLRELFPERLLNPARPPDFPPQPEHFPFARARCLAVDLCAAP